MLLTSPERERERKTSTDFIYSLFPVTGTCFHLVFTGTFPPIFTYFTYITYRLPVATYLCNQDCVNLFSERRSRTFRSFFLPEMEPLDRAETTNSSSDLSFLTGGWTNTDIHTRAYTNTTLMGNRCSKSFRMCTLKA